ncbi:MAG: cupin domain-containing protein [Proteobacteria bacterium]|nr:cupin domain-containing protein [Pseudomonadota bacterium]MBU2262271.1 cupin domain-containing protein [Pseudomonadota bacterium]
MGFWNHLNRLDLQDFRPGIQSRAEFGDRLVMACMEIAPGKEDTGHQHPFEQCGIIVKGKIEMFIGDERRVLGAMETYFIPAGAIHGWKTLDLPARILDVSAKQG